jgi:hypothetical protein
LKVLKLSAQGLPQSWISLEQAVIHYASDEVRWESGGEVAVFHGGHNAVTGLQSIIRINSIIGTRGVPNINPFNLRPGLTNSKLFARDRNVCAYCGDHFHEEDLTREHIIPFANHGVDPATTARVPARPRRPTCRCCTHPTCPACGKTSFCAIAAYWLTRWNFLWPTFLGLLVC